jgi:hypothetical protein
MQKLWYSLQKKVLKIQLKIIYYDVKCRLNNQLKRLLFDNANRCLVIKTVWFIVASHQSV